MIENTGFVLFIFHESIDFVCVFPYFGDIEGSEILIERLIL